MSALKRLGILHFAKNDETLNFLVSHSKCIYTSLAKLRKNPIITNMWKKLLHPFISIAVLNFIFFSFCIFHYIIMIERLNTYFSPVSLLLFLFIYFWQFSWNLDEFSIIKIDFFYKNDKEIVIFTVYLHMSQSSLRRGIQRFFSVTDFS